MEKMFTFDAESGILSVELPQGHTMAELTEAAREEITAMVKAGVFYGKDVKILGRLTTSMAVMLGHELAHVSRSISMFDPKEAVYVLCVKH